MAQAPLKGRKQGIHISGREICISASELPISLRDSLKTLFDRPPGVGTSVECAINQFLCPNGRSMGVNQATLAREQEWTRSRWASSQCVSASSGGRAALSFGLWLSLAPVAAPLSSCAHGLWLLPRVARGWNMATYPRCVTRQGAPKSRTSQARQRGQHRQPERLHARWPRRARL